jgi:hypothetical protein
VIKLYTLSLLLRSTVVGTWCATGWRGAGTVKSIKIRAATEIAVLFVCIAGAFQNNENARMVDSINGAVKEQKAPVAIGMAVLLLVCITGACWAVYWTLSYGLAPPGRRFRHSKRL